MANYQVVYNGIMLAMDRQEVVQQFARLFKLPTEKAAAILDRPKTVLRSQLDAGSAEVYREKLMAIGLDVDVVDTSIQKPAVLRAADMMATSQAAAEMTLASVDEPANPDAEPVARYHGNRQLAFDFHGSGLEFFRIWIVNVFLTVLTLGIYSAWAKVRTQQYFYGNTEVAGASFQYLARPMQILKGRMIGVVLLVLYVVSQKFSLQAGLVALAVLLLLSPVLLVLGLNGRLRFTAWRHVSFNFERNFREAYIVSGMPLLVIGLLIGIGQLAEASGQQHTGMTAIVGVIMIIWLVLFPYWIFAFNRFMVSNASYGTEPFRFAASGSDYYKLFFLKVPALVLLISLLSGLVVAASMGAGITQQWQTLLQAQQSGVDVSPDPSLYGAAGAAVMLMVVGYALLIAYVQASLFNLRYDGMSLGKSRLSCEVRTWPLLWLYLSNTVLILLTAGLMIPWARVRMVNYRLSCLALHASYELDDIVNEARQTSAVGQEVSDLFDIDIAF